MWPILYQLTYPSRTFWSSATVRGFVGGRETETLPAPVWIFAFGFTPKPRRASDLFVVLLFFATTLQRIQAHMITITFNLWQAKIVHKEKGKPRETP